MIDILKQIALSSESEVWGQRTQYRRKCSATQNKVLSEVRRFAASCFSGKFPFFNRNTFPRSAAELLEAVCDWEKEELNLSPL